MSNVSLSQWQTAQRHEHEFWEGYAQTYARFPQILLEHLAKLRDVGEYVAGELDSDGIEETLEVGVGPLGIGVLGMLGRGRRITAIDPLPRIEIPLRDPMLERYVRSLRDGVEYRRVQAESLPFDDDTFDFVCCHNVIDHARDPVSILNEMLRVLKPDRSLFLTLNTFSVLGRVKFETLRRFNPEKLIFACHPHSFLHARVLAMLRAAGYEVVRHEGGEKAFAGRGQLSKFLCKKPADRLQAEPGSRRIS